MGIKGLTKLLADNAPKAMKEQKFESYFGRKIAIDASMSIYQYLIVLGRCGTQTLTNKAGEVTSHLQGMFGRTVRLLEAGIMPVYVFDGMPPDLKKKELAKRVLKRDDAINSLNEALKTGSIEDIEKFSKRTVKATEKHYEDCKRLLRLMGVPVIEAPCEAEAQCSALCKAGKVYAVASEDMDTLAFGAPRFLRHFLDSSSKRIDVMEFELIKVLEELNLTMDQFIDLCILSGCDYCESIRGIGGSTALKQIRQYGSIEGIMENLNRKRYQIPEEWTYMESRSLFKEPSVLTEDHQLQLKWTDPDEDSIERVMTAKSKLSYCRSESFFKPAVSQSVPAERVETRCAFVAPKPVMKVGTCYPVEASVHSRPKAMGSKSPSSLDMRSSQPTMFC
ncbi:flap endonuclease 1 [Striga asiatica]|uniref:Flap endonuclease 1 n=1 Tax=Striga asiatica TaxID=4170 RepID=A0A5A7QUN2_STRAF|nr:flap endonuclease 1 [Striga asiatica]